MLQYSRIYKSTTHGTFDTDLRGHSGAQIFERKISASFCNQPLPRLLRGGERDFLGTTYYAYLQLLA